MSRETLKYTREELTVVWKPKLCIHAALCFKGLPQVFDPKARPWVKIDGADAQAIVDQVRKCPSGALSIENGVEPTPLNTDAGTDASAAATEILVTANGPFVVKGKILIKYADGQEEIKEGSTALCRCGLSGNKPYCDGSHRNSGLSN